MTLFSNHAPHPAQAVGRRALIAAVGAGALGCATRAGSPAAAPRSQALHAPGSPVRDFPLLVGSSNALAGMRLHYAALASGAEALDVAIGVVKVAEADPEDMSVGLGGLPNEDGVVQLDAGCMHGPTHNSGAVAALENILHPSEVARLVMERTDHCLLVGEGAYRFARRHGHAHVELLTDAARREWLEWKEASSARDDWLPPAAAKPEKGASLDDQRRAFSAGRTTGTIHCSALSVRGELACTTTTSGLAWKIAGRVGDTPIVGAGLYCDQEAGSAGATGRGEAAVLANASFALVELMRGGLAPLEAGLEVLRRVARQAERQARWQPALLDRDGRPAFGLNLYALGLDGSYAGVTLRGSETFAVADPERGPRLEPSVALF